MAQPARQVVTGGPTVTVRSPRVGTFEVPLDRLITFDAGLVGLPDTRRFALLEPERPDSPFRYLACVDEPALGFVVCDPEDFWPGYGQHVPRPHEAGNEVALLALVTVPTDPMEMTANLMAPLVVDVGARRGWQLVLEHGPYETRHRLLPPRPAADATAR